MRSFWSVAVGAALGGLCRYYLGLSIQQRAGAGFPFGTLTINVTGSFIIGFIMRFALATSGVNETARLFLTTGFCGGYTTFSTFSYESLRLMEDGDYGAAAGYVAASVVLALGATWAGIGLASRFVASGTPQH